MKLILYKLDNLLQLIYTLKNDKIVTVELRFFNLNKYI